MSTYDGQMASAAAVYEGTTPETWQEIGCFVANDQGSSRVALHAHVVAGLTYTIQAGGWGRYGVPAEDAFSFSLDIGSGPLHDDLADARALTLPWHDSTDFTFASTQPGESYDCKGYGYYRPGSVWYTYTPTYDETVYFESTGTVSLYTGTDFDSLKLESCPRNGSQTFLDADTPYLIRVEGPPGNISFDATLVPRPGHDDFADAIVMGDQYDTEDTMEGATLEAGEPLASCRGYGHNLGTVWYTYTTTQRGRIRVTAEGSAATVAIYTGSSLGDLVEQACYKDASWGDTTFVANVVAATTYIFQVTGRDRSIGDGFHFEFQPRPAHDNFDRARVITGTPYTDEVDTLAAQREASEPTNCGDPRHTVWYRYTPTEPGTIKLTTSSTQMVPMIAAYTGSRVEAAIAVACHQPTSGQSASVEFRASPSVPYYFQVAGQDSKLGDIEFSFAFTPDL